MTSTQPAAADRARAPIAGLAASSAYPAGAMAEKFAADRLAAFGRGDVAALLAHYAEDAVVVTPAGILRGRDQIRGMIEGIIAEFAQPGVVFELLSQHAVGPVVTFSWRAETAANRYDLGAETYFLDGGRAAFQTFAARVTPR